MSVLSFPFMQHAVLAAFLCSVACGIIGSLVILNRLSYLAGAVAHAAYGGIGIAFVSGFPVLPCTMGFSLASSLVMARTMVKDGDIAPGRTADTAMGILWAGGMALGVILIDLSPGYAGDLMGFLFGSILAVPVENLAIMGALDLLLLGALYRYGQGLTAITFDPEFARARGLPVPGLFYLLVGMTAVAVVMLLQIVGLILVIALLTIPPYMGRRMTRSLSGMMLASALLCFVFCLAGLALAYVLDISPGAVIIAVATAAYGVQMLLRQEKE
ncbi:MAG: metal ABC transporter permease [Deltaproteobacteria bacterium]|nr:metal ABC transporter permease [Deltaproteobacteria bacterium]